MKYLRNGQAVDVVCELPNQLGFVVQKYYDNPDGGQYLDDQKKVVERVYDSPPVEHIDKRVRDAETKLRDLEGAIHNANRELRTVEQERKAILTKLQQVPALRRLEAWIDGKVTHFVTVNWRSVQVLTKAELICQSDAEDRHRRPPGRMKLVTLFGDTNGDINWNVNQYRDGSGSSEQECFMCCSEEEAKTKAAEIIDEKFREVDSGKPDAWLGDLIKSAEAIGHPVADRYREIVKQAKIDDLQKKVINARQALENIEKQMSLVQNGEHCPQLEAF
jgi:hypothetical protein